MLRRFGIVAVAGLAATGCSTITEGTSQDITVATTPAGATCTLTRDGQAIATINPTPGTATIDRSKKNILITCHKGGFAEASYTDEADVAAATFSNIMTAGVGFAVDIASGADSKYDGSVMIPLRRTSPDTAPILRQATLPMPMPPAPIAVPPPAVVAVAPPPPPAPPPGTERRVFGIGVATLQTQLVSAVTPVHGVVVVVVQPGTAAARAGLTEGDIVTSIGGRDIAERGDVQRVISGLPAGATVLVHIIRGTRQLDLSAQL